MESLKKIESVVEKVLEKKEVTRENDDLLYMCVCEYFHRGSSSMSVKDFFMTRNQTACPNFASVTRARRKVFEKRPELKPTKVTKGRKKMEEVYREYALNC